MSNTFEFCFLDVIIGDLQTVRFERRDARPLDPLPPGAVLRERDIEKPTDEKYCKWTGDALEAMTDEERAARDAYDLAQWQASEEYARRFSASQIVAGIQATLTSIGVVASEKAQVFSDVDAWVQAAETAGEKVARLETAMRLQMLYAQLAELIGDPAGLINGTKTINLESE